MSGSPVSVGKVKSGAGRPSSTKRTSKRAVGVVRVSRKGDREGDRFVSPFDQAERIRAACERDGLELVDVFEEIDVSGGAPLEQRPGLSRAVALIEAGDAEIVMVAFFDRLVRSVRVQEEVVARVEAAGGMIMALDIGEIRADTAARRLSSTMLGAVNEYHRLVTAERTAEAKRRAVERGVAPFPNLPPGYRRGEERRTERDPVAAPIVLDAFQRRAAGATLMVVREFLRENGIERTYHGVNSMLKSRFYLGELRFGEDVNLSAHPEIVDVATWNAVQRMSVPRGRRAKSERLLARLGVLRCAFCGSRMVVGSANHGRYVLYRCPPNGDCAQRVTISADVAESVVIDQVRALVAGISGRAGAETGAHQAEHEYERIDAELQSSIRVLAGLEDEPAAKERLLELRAARDAAFDRAHELHASVLPLVTVSASGDWDVLTMDEQRAIIRAVVERVEVARGQGRGRVSVFPRSQ